ncbi:MAG TPA: hypothetical protein VMQ61_04140 [Thermoanaerobaculia bacterium]|nr:hypothetical protein [Thermoanaerobaculia bacterium]
MLGWRRTRAGSRSTRRVAAIIASFLPAPANERHDAEAGGSLALSAFAYETPEDVGCILGGLARTAGEPDAGKFTRTLGRGAGVRWLIASDMDNGNRRAPGP